MKNYYEILGIDEEVTQDEIRARWAELTKLYHPDVLQNPEADDRIKEINEAYQVLKDYSTRLEYDLERALRRSVLRKTEERKKIRRRKILLPIGVATGVVIVVIGFFVLFPKGPEFDQESIKIVIPPSAKVPVPEPPKVVESKKPEEPKERDKREKPVEVAKIVPKEPVKVVVPEPPKVVEPKKPDKRDKRKEPEKPVEVAKVIPREPVRVVVPKPPKVVEPKKPEERDKGDKREKPVEAAKVIPREPVRVVVPEPRKVVEPKKPVEIAKIVPKEPVKVIVPEPPKVVEPKKPEEPKERDKREKPVSGEEELKRLFAGYVGKYNQKDVEGFLSFFSSRAIQNQKYGMDRIRKIYTNFFNQSQELKYQVKDLKTETLPGGMEVKARYELTQISKEGGEKKSWGGQARWVLVKEDGVLKILSLDYQHQK